MCSRNEILSILPTTKLYYAIKKGESYGNGGNKL